MFSSLDTHMASAKPATILATSMALILTISAIDYADGYDFGLSIFYVLPVFIATWYHSRTSGYLISLLAAAAWLASDILSGHPYQHQLAPYWNAMVRLAYFILISALFTRIRGRLYAQEHLADTDELTGIANRRSFKEGIESELIRFQRYHQPLTLTYIDLDHFKSVNDSGGHEMGDQVLCTVAGVLKSTSRRSDLVARLGGDEFGILFVNTDFSEGEITLRKLGDHLQQAMDKHHWPITFSIGAISFDEPLVSVRDMVSAADALMYQVKRHGKNAIIHRCWESSPARPS